MAPASPVPVRPGGATAIRAWTAFGIRRAGSPQAPNFWMAHGGGGNFRRGGGAPTPSRPPRGHGMTLVLIIVVLLLLFGGGGFYGYRSPRRADDLGLFAPSSVLRIAHDDRDRG